MKTGRVRSKEEMPAEEPRPVPEGQAPAGETPPPAPAATLEAVSPVKAQAPAGKRLPLIFIVVAAVIACLVLIVVLRSCTRAREWVPASQVTGNWTAGVQLLVPQVQTNETWQASCQSAQGIVQQATCVLKPTGQFNDQPTRTYDEFAVNSYYDETWRKTYDAQGTEFVTTELGGDDRIENNQRLVSKEYLKDGTCQQTQYTVWVDDPQDSTQQIEVYLYDCEVWEQVSVYDSAQAPWCQCQVTVLAPMPVQTVQGTGLQVTYPTLLIPQGGKAEQSFQASVTFVGGDGQYTLTQTTNDPAQYRDWLTTPYYLGIRDGKAVNLSTEPKK
jgi:hypothetical protein